MSSNTKTGYYPVFSTMNYLKEIGNRKYKIKEKKKWFQFYFLLVLNFLLKTSLLFLSQGLMYVKSDLMKEIMSDTY